MTSNRPVIYLDHAATTPIDPEVVSAMSDVWLRGLVNPASQHRPGQAARRVLEQAREQILASLGADVRSFPADQLLFTSGGTEANNWALLGLARAGRQLLTSAVEHPSIRDAAVACGTRPGVSTQVIPVNSDGLCDLEALERMLTERPTALVSVMLVNNETGVIQPIREIVGLCRPRGVLVHTDAVQAVGKIPVSFAELGCDLLTLTPHKFHGPRGIGALVARPGVPLLPLLFGGFQQQGLRPGTEDPGLAVGFAEALRRAVLHQASRYARWQQLQSQLIELWRSSVRGEWFIAGELAERSPHVLNVAFPGVDRQTLMLAADVAGIALSTGSACASGSSEVSPVLTAMGLPMPWVDSSVRISFGKDTDATEVLAAGEILATLVNDLRSS